jgi:hypothetical protein
VCDKTYSYKIRYEFPRRKTNKATIENKYRKSVIKKLKLISFLSLKIVAKIAVNKRGWRGIFLLDSPFFGDFYQYENHEGYDNECYQGYQKASNSELLTSNRNFQG